MIVLKDCIINNDVKGFYLIDVIITIKYYLKGYNIAWFINRDVILFDIIVLLDIICKSYYYTFCMYKNSSKKGGIYEDKEDYINSFGVRYFVCCWRRDVLLL